MTVRAIIGYFTVLETLGTVSATLWVCLATERRSIVPIYVRSGESKVACDECVRRHTDNDDQQEQERTILLAEDFLEHS